MGRLDGKVALITGGARGQGAAEGRLFASEGATVYLTDVRAEQGAKTASDIGATFLVHDVTSPDRWEAVVQRVIGDHGRVDVLVNNAGILLWASMRETQLDDWERIVAVNQTGVFLGMRAVAPHMSARGAGSIVNISSVAGLRGAAPCFAYAATKWAVRGMTKGAAQELGPHGVRVNSIHPGVIDTPMLADRPLAEMAARVPLGRHAEADEVARLALWLASDESAYANGAEFVLDGGQTA
ncbi:MAG TPA: glucose 1-dehydrogenase [Acidimicrobiia bacterium]|nr:glucose 1-dehydrogenase [Acidimicrobiia bacterium]